MKKILVISLLLSVLLSGCAISEGRQDNATTIAPPIINLPPAQQVDTSKLEGKVSALEQGLKSEIQASSNNTQNQLSGLVNASISKLGDKLTGVEANLKDLLNVHLTMTNNVSASANAEIRARLEANLKALSDINAQIQLTNQMSASLSSEIRASITATNEMKAEIGKMTANAQVGVANKINDIYTKLDNTAGRDVNYLPKEAVFIVLGTLALVSFVFLLTILVAGKNAREQEKQRTEVEKENVARWQTIALEAISHLEPDKASRLRSLIMEKKNG